MGFFRKARGKIFEWRWWIIGVVVIGEILTLTAFVPDWPDITGFDGKTVWDLLDLFIIPVALALVVYWLNRHSRKRELQAERRRDLQRINILKQLP